MAKEQRRPFADEISEQGLMSLFGHLAELRNRILYSVAGLVVGVAVSYNFSPLLLDFLMEPVRQALPEQGEMVFHTVIEPIYTNFLLALLAGIVISSPHTFYHFWKFVAPGLTSEERNLTVPFIISATVWFLLGTLFAYLVFFPFTFQFLIGFASEDIRPMLSTLSYVSFSLQMLGVFGVLFEMPVLSWFLTKLGLLTSHQMRSFRRFAIVLAFVLGAILTPPDPVSQIVMSIPIVLLYEISILSAWLAERGMTKKSEFDEPEEVQPRKKQVNMDLVITKRKKVSKLLNTEGEEDQRSSEDS